MKLEGDEKNWVDLEEELGGGLEINLIKMLCMHAWNSLIISV